MTRIIASSGATHNPGETGLAYDGNPGTRWTSKAAQDPTMAYWVELDAPAMITGISATSTTWPDDNPRQWVVAVMDDDGGHGRKEVARGEGPVVASWAPVRGQVVKIEQVGKDDFYWWSIEDLSVDATDAPPVVEPAPEPEPIVVPGPESASEPLARYWVEFWAEKFGWRVVDRNVVDLQQGTIAIERHVVYLTARARAGGVLDAFPFTEKPIE